MQKPREGCPGIFGAAPVCTPSASSHITVSSVCTNFLSSVTSSCSSETLIFMESSKSSLLSLKLSHPRKITLPQNFLEKIRLLYIEEENLNEGRLFNQ